MKFFSSKKEVVPPTDLSYPLFYFQNADKDKPNVLDVFRLEDAVRGVQSFGGIGSGKSTGSGRELALAYLRNGYSGPVLCGKIDEKDQWLGYAKETNRMQDILVFEPGSPYTFDPLQYELDRAKKEGGGYADNIVSLFLSIIKMGNRINGGEGLDGREPFWNLAMKRMLKAGIDLLRLAKLGKGLQGTSSGKEFDLTVANLAKVLRDTPLGESYYRKFFKICLPSTFDQQAALQAWADNSFTIYCLTWAAAYIHHLQELKEDELKREVRADIKIIKECESEERAFEAISAYFLTELPTLAEKTRSSILEHYFAFSSMLRSGLVADHFAVGTTPEILPERTFEGKIVMLNFPVHQFQQLGIVSQCMYKKTWMQAVQRRFVTPSMLPVFIWQDEAHFFLSDDDQQFMTTARTSKACSVMISQNISNYYAAMGGSDSKAKVDALLACMSCKIFHSQNDAVTNDWAGETISKDYRSSLTIGDSGNTIGQEYQYQFLPRDYSLLLTGGWTNKGIVEAVITIAGRKFSNGKNFLKVKFQQNLK